MSKKIASLGITIDHDSVENLNYKDKHSLSEFDILIFQPHFIHKYEQELNNYKGKKCLTENSSPQFFVDMNHWNKEIVSFINFGKTVVILSDTKEDVYYDTGRRQPINFKSKTSKKIINPTSNYQFLETIIKNIKITASKGKAIVQEKNTEIFTNLHYSFKDNFEYRVYFEHEDLKPIFKTKHNQIVGGIRQYQGVLILLPYIDINEENKHDFIKNIIQIDKSVKNESTPIPNWAIENHKTPQETVIYNEIKEKSEGIEELSNQKKQLEIELKEEQKYKELLFETGKPLENIVIESLKILGYEKAENFTNETGDEIDIILTSPEGHIYCGECEGKENKAIDVDKFRQLLDHINVYEESLGDNITDIYGILFGNAYRLKDIETREENFTKKCIERAKRKNIILVKTSDLYSIIQYLREHANEEFKKLCRDTIHNSLGSIVQFPAIPK